MYVEGMPKPKRDIVLYTGLLEVSEHIDALWVGTAEVAVLGDGTVALGLNGLGAVRDNRIRLEPGDNLRKMVMDHAASVLAREIKQHDIDAADAVRRKSAIETHGGRDWSGRTTRWPDTRISEPPKNPEPPAT